MAQLKTGKATEITCCPCLGARQRTPHRACGVRLALLAWLVALVLAPGAGQAVELSPPEARYVEEHGLVTLCVDPDWAPFESINAQGAHEGIAADLLRLVAERTGLRWQLVPTASWDESLAASRDGRCQLLSFLNKTPQREEWLIFSRPLFSDVNVFITREEHPFISDPGKLAGESIAFPSGTAMEELVRRDYPNLTIHTTATEDEAIGMVAAKKADMTMRSLIVAAYTIKKQGLFNLKIAGQLPYYSNNLCIGIAGNDERLRDIVNKGIASITTAERAAIENRHVSINVQTVTDYGNLAKVLGVVLALAALGGLWAWKIKRLNAALRKEIERREELERMRDDVEQIIRHDLVTPLSGIISIPELLEGEKNLTRQQQELLHHAANSGRRMLATIRLAGALSRMEKGTYAVALADCDVLDLLRGIRANLESLFVPKRLGFTVLVDGRTAAAGERVLVRGDANLLGNLFENLIKNAAEASPVDGEVALALDTAAKTFSIRNQGEVPAGIVATFFEKYVTSGKTFGTGLGTYSARIIARAHGGDVTLDASEPGATTVRVSLPGVGGASGS
ncbi:transporter substrate-binding domain-containing protein [Desulfovibrio sp. TomC]|uniref:transporter substrate-binding domain-containing protein n=1 Tax=Desulfovibrio sp. TomC TaxID=1562888 RepID=UPI000574D6AF|nr:transporter substrate-binding domain-containing protein [Desulfovibrio sp. TomC]KHK01601.1 diguanylate cyclase (GGDEF domain) with PAS/PAC sensor [Desulfovibrio sp. TomC]